MTTLKDFGGSTVTRLRCPLEATDRYSTLVLALRDMRTANRRDPETGDGTGNESWIGLALGMIVLDTLTGDTSNGKNKERWLSLLTTNGVESEDAAIIYAVRNAVLHGYGIPRPENVFGRQLFYTSYTNAYALDTEAPDFAMLSVPVFCGQLVERIASAVPDAWDKSFIRVDVRF